MTKPGDLDHYTRVRCYQALLDRYPQHTAKLSLLPLAMRMGGPREAVLARHHPQELRLHATSSSAATTPARATTRAGQAVLRPLRRAGAARGSTRRSSGVEMVPFQMMVYVEELDAYMPEDEVPAGARTLDISGTELRRAWPRAARSRPGSPSRRSPRELRRTHPPRHEAGLHRLLHRPLGRRQVDDRERAAGQVPGDGRPAGDPARRRHRAQAPLLRARLLEGAPRHQHPPHRLRRLGDHQERRHRDLRADRALRRGAQGGAAR